MEIGLVNVHVGKAIEARILELGISKLEFANMFGIKGQHVKRILERETIETEQLVKISSILDFNFFSLFCYTPTRKGCQTVNTKANIQKPQSDLEINTQTIQIASLSIQKKSLDQQVLLLKDQIAILKNSLNDKNTIIEMLNNQIK
jgi:hypothetical protein